MHHACLKIGPVSYYIHSQSELVAHETCANFLTTAPQEESIDMELVPVTAVQEPAGTRVHTSEQRWVYLDEAGLEHRVNLWDGQILGIAHETDPTHIKAELLIDPHTPIPISTAVLEFFNLEKHLLQKEALVLHSSFIEYRGKAILFTAPSGTGKSTQAALWNRYEGTETINGDRSIVHRTAPGVFRVHGLPFCGSSQIHLNREMPLGAIVFLEQSPQNVVAPMKPAHAFGKLYAEMSVNSWNRTAVEKSMRLIEELVGSVPMVHLKCNMAQDAVNTLKNFLHETAGY